MKYREIIFVYIHMLTNRDVQRFGIAYMQERGYKVNLVTIWMNNSLKDFVYTDGNYSGENYISIEVDDYEDYVKKHPRALYILCGMWREEYIPAVKVMGFCESDYVVMGNHGLTHRVYSYYRNKSVKNSIKSVYKKARFRVEQIKKAKLKKPVLITAVNKDKIGVPEYLIDDNLKLMHAFDYDRYIENQREGVESTEEYIVFIEDGLCGLDQDTVMAGYADPIDKEKWQEQVSKVLDLLEKYYNLPTIIAGHPHAQYEDNEFCGRRIVVGKTEKLIPRAKLVIMQMSTVIDQALLYNKDILILTNGDIHNFPDIGAGSWYNNWIVPTCEYLGLKECNMDDSDAISQPYKYVSTVSEELKDKYIGEYVKAEGTDDKLIIEFIEEAVLEE